MKRRLWALDILRIISVGMIFLFHMKLHIGCTFGIFTPFISQGAIFMSLFFMISGFAVHYQYKNVALSKKDNIYSFYIKKLAGLYPLYVFYGGLNEIIYGGTLNLKQALILAPIEIFLLQSFFEGVNGYATNGGTWFLSCLMLCFVLSPFFNDVIRQLTKKTKVILIFILCAACMYVPFVCYKFNAGGIYNNILFRAFEYVIGMLICSIASEKAEDKKGKRNLIIILMALLLLVMIVSIVQLYNVGWYIAGSFGQFDFYLIITIPIFCLCLYFSGGGYQGLDGRTGKILSYANSLSYSFFFAQSFAWKLIHWLEENTMLFDIFANRKKIILSFILTVLIAVIFYEVVQKPCKRIICNKFLK